MKYTNQLSEMTEISKPSKLQNSLIFIYLFFCFAVFDIPSGSVSALLAYHLFTITLGILTIIVFKAHFVIKRDGILYLYLYLSLVLLFSFNNPRISLASFSLLFSATGISILSGSLLICNPTIFRKTIDRLLSLHIVALFTQYIYNALFGFIINFHEIIFPFSESQHREIYALNISRITGIYNEPGTYSTWIMSLIYISMILNNHLKILHFAALLSIALTFSTSGYIYILGLSCTIVYYFVFKNPTVFRITKLSFIIITTTYCLTLFGAYDYFIWRFFDSSVIDGTTNSKIDTLSFIYSTDSFRFLFGSGFSVNDCHYCESIQDVGLFFNMFFQLGIFSLLALYLMLRFCRPRAVLFGAFLISLLISKMFIFSISLWVSVAIIGCVARNKYLVLQENRSHSTLYFLNVRKNII